LQSATGDGGRESASEFLSHFVEQRGPAVVVDAVAAVYQRQQADERMLSGEDRFRGLGDFEFLRGGDLSADRFGRCANLGDGSEGLVVRQEIESTLASVEMAALRISRARSRRFATSSARRSSAESSPREGESGAGSFGVNSVAVWIVRVRSSSTSRR
jgi:hypothetical protein